MDRIQQLCRSVQEEVTQWRHHFHENPELGFAEVNTTAFIVDRLKSFGIEVWQPTKTGVIGIIRGEKPGKTIAYRADIDALPIQESEENNPRSKTDGVMHACGHDGHTATLLGVAKVLAELRDELTGEIRLIFQPAEECPPGGAVSLVAAGVMKAVDCVFGMHYTTTDPAGLFSIKEGPLYASTCDFDIIVTGAGVHAAYPHKGKDTILIASNLVVALNGIIPRSIDSTNRCVLSVTTFQGGTAHNVIPETVTIGGTMRYLNEESGQYLIQRVHEVADGIARMYGATVEVRLTKGYQMLENHPEPTQAVRKILTQHFGEDAVIEAPAVMGGEDFSAYVKETRGCYYRIGAMKPKADGKVYPAHQCKYEMSDDALVFGVEAGVRILLEAPSLLS